LAIDNRPEFETYILRPAMVVARGMSLRSLTLGLGPSVKVDVLAKTMLDLAVHGGDKNIWENADINQGVEVIGV
jgi:hypothetical protein